MVIRQGETKMAYTVKQLAKLSGVSVRTLHFYDEAGLLKPAWYGANGYRYYEQPQLLLLQQILFYRELGFELKQIQRILGRGDFDQLAALRSHREVLQKDLARTRKLIVTIDKTIEHLKGRKQMKDQELYRGFDPVVQAKHEQYLIDRFGEGMKESIAESHKQVKNWTKADWEKSSRAFDAICKDFTRLMTGRQAAEAPEVQAVTARHYRWLKQFWTPNRESYTGHTLLIVDSDLRKAYEVYDAKLPEFVAAAIKVYAANELA
jgi:DNA-binding transcriptional MerR regulator